MKFVQIMTLVFFYGLTCCPARAAAVESYRYEEIIGGVVKGIRWCVNKSEPVRLLYQNKEEKYITRTDESSATVEWEMEKKSEDTCLHARRQPRAIVIQGRLKGRRIAKELTIDDAPWYQATSWSLRAFVLSSQDEIRFWTVRNETLEVHKIRAVKKHHEILDLNGKKEDAVQVELRLTGLLAPFWKSSYWFRATDGVFLRFEGPSGPPGSPVMVVEYRGPAAPCKLRALELTGGDSPKAF